MFVPQGHGGLVEVAEHPRGTEAIRPEMPATYPPEVRVR